MDILTALSHAIRTRGTTTWCAGVTAIRVRRTIACSKLREAPLPAGFTGYDCSLRTCPFGDDPVTPDVEFAECSNRGVCDRYDGTCNCFSGFGASDGNAHKGTLDDCGYITPIPLAGEDIPVENPDLTRAMLNVRVP